MTTLLPRLLRQLTEEERVAMIELYREEADSFVLGILHSETRCPIGEVRPVTVYKQGRSETVYRRDTCDCPQTTALLGGLPFLCSVGEQPCQTKRTLFPNGTFS